MAKASELKDKFQRTAAGEGRAPATQAPAPASAPMASAPETTTPIVPTQLRPAPEPQEAAVPMPEPARHPKQTVRITADIDKDLHRSLKQFCLDNDCNGQDVVRYLLHLGLVADTDLRTAVAQYVSRSG